MKNLLNKQFLSIYQRNDGIAYFSPARVNLIGEHIDYNGGYVFPVALSFGTYGIVAKRSDINFRIYSDSFSKVPYVFDLNTLVPDQDNSWVDYIKGVILAVLKRGYTIAHGFDLYIHGNMPYGAGLSSSASLESLIVTILDDLFSLGLSLEEKAQIGKDAENDFVGINSGIMDQFAVLAGKSDHAILLNTDTLSYKYIPLALNTYKIVIVNTNKKRGLTDSKYNERFNECRNALKILKPIYLIDHLCDLKPAILPSIQSILKENLFKRVKHVVTEQQRTIDAANALKTNDLEKFADLMIASHTSLRDDYDVTGIELDTLQALLIKHGALGARMTGAGFGGSCVAIVDSKMIDNLKVNVSKAYESIIGYPPSFYEALPSDGTHKI